MNAVLKSGCLLAFYLLTLVWLPANIQINEIVAVSSGIAPSQGITDPDPALYDPSNFADWVELHNPTATDIEVSGWSLSDDTTAPFLYTFPPGTMIPAGGYLVIIADDHPANSTNYLHAPFKLSSSGETLLLSDAAGSFVDLFTFPSQVSSHSFGLSGTTGVYWETATPGAANLGNSATQIVNAPQFSEIGGIHDSPINVTLTTTTSGASIHYTLDGSEPDQTSPVYAAPIASVPNECLCIRAIAYLPGLIPSAVSSRSFLMNPPAELRLLPTIHWMGKEGEVFWGNGLIDNHTLKGREAEKRASMEFHFPDGSTSTQLDVGLRPAGHGTYASNFQPEVSPWTYRWRRPQFNAFFRGEYGASTLNLPLFSNEDPVDSYNSLRIRLGNSDGTNPFIIDEFIRRIFRDMGHFSSVGTLKNLYINGQFYAVTNPVQRIREPLLQQWHQSSERWDVKQIWEYPDGDDVAFRAMRHFFEESPIDTLAEYQEAASKLDMVNFVDYLMLLTYMGTGDWPGNNKVISRERSPNGLFRYHVWDAEQSLTDDGLNPHRDPIQRILENNSGGITIFLEQLLASEEFRLLWADRVQKQFFNGGPLTESQTSKRWFELSDQYKPLLTYIWNTQSNDHYFTDWRDMRRQQILTFYQYHGLWFDDISAPVFSHSGGQLSGNLQLEILQQNADPNGTQTIYYTTDGSDPRLPGGAISSTALAYAGPLQISTDAVILARVHDSDPNAIQPWSPCEEAAFYFTNSVKITELMYHPVSGDEFIEIKNPGSTAAPLGNLRLTEGVSFDFSIAATQTLAPGEIAILVRDLAAFQATYGNALNSQILGTYTGKLSNGGERLTLATASGTVLQDFSYDDSWYLSTDGGGDALHIVDPHDNYNDASNWNALSPSPGTCNISTSDSTPPEVTLSTLATTVNGPFSVFATFSETVNGVDASDFILSSGSLSHFSNTGNTATFTVTPANAGNLTITINAGVVEDTAGNANTLTDVLTINYTAPLQDSIVPVISMSTSNATVFGAFSVTATTSEPTLGFTLADLQVTNGNLSDFSGYDDTYTFTVTPTGQGNVTITAPSNSLFDFVFNTNAQPETLIVNAIIPNNDDDGDGIPNAVEYAFGMDQNDATDCHLLPLPMTTPTGAYSVQFIEPIGITNVTYEAEQSTDMAIWTSIPDTGSSTSHQFTITGEERAYFRYKITVD